MPTTGLRAGLCIGVTVVVVAISVHGAAGAAGPKTLGEAMADRHGHAAGDSLYAGQGRKGVDADADGVNDGRKKQASGVKVGPHAAVTSDQLLSNGDRSGACTIGYGKGLQCLPTTPPSAGRMGMSVAEMPWTCAELRTVLPAGVVLNQRGVDPARLDSNDDGTACGAGDR